MISKNASHPGTLKAIKSQIVFNVVVFGCDWQLQLSVGYIEISLVQSTCKQLFKFVFRFINPVLDIHFTVQIVNL